MENESVVEMPRSVYENHPQSFAIQIQSDVMEPTIPKGWIVIVDFASRKPIESGETGLVLAGPRNAPSEQWYPCRTLRLGDQVLVMVDNPNYDSVLLPVDDIAIMGTLCWTQPFEDDLEGIKGHWLDIQGKKRRE